MAGHPVLPEGSPPPLAPYSPGFRSGQFVCTAGMLALDSTGNLVGEGDRRRADPPGPRKHQGDHRDSRRNDGRHRVQHDLPRRPRGLPGDERGLRLVLPGEPARPRLRAGRGSSGPSSWSRSRPPRSSATSRGCAPVSGLVAAGPGERPRLVVSREKGRSSRGPGAGTFGSRPPPGRPIRFGRRPRRRLPGPGRSGGPRGPARSTPARSRCRRSPGAGGIRSRCR